ncbi:MAG: ELM1/GtrOC1 family putative glycosyltransferase [Candidatus Omnitrophota bacterium]
MLDYIACILVRLLNIIFSVIPISFSLWLGRRIGSLAFMLNKKRRVIAYANLKSAFSKEKSPRELRAITKSVYKNLMQTFVEILNLTKVDKKYIEKYVEIPHLERLVNASNSGRGTILLTAHFGDWELSSLTSAVVGYPITVLVREQKMKRLNELLNQLRESKGCKVIRKGMSTKNLLRALLDKNIVGILADQDAGKNGVFVDFFARPTSTHIGPAEIARRTNSLILPSFMVRVKGPYHKIFLEEYIDFKTASGADSTKEVLQRFASLLEFYIRKYPDQWLWQHKRWKSTPVRTVMVLNDGRAGHLNQSLAIARQIQKARAQRGFTPDDTKIVVVDVKFKSRFHRTLAGIFASFSSWRCHGRMWVLELCLEKDCYKELMASYCDFVVSCGSAIAPVNAYMAKENNAKNITIMKPTGMFNAAKHFKLMVIPEHDLPRPRKNILVTTLAPNLVESGSHDEAAERLRPFIKPGDGKFISLFVGGDNPEYRLTGELIACVVDEVVKFAESHGAGILATTSRRTNKDVEDILKQRLGSHERCRLLVVANDRNIDGAVNGMLHMSDIAIVSGESVSMVSEAVSSGKKVVAFELEKKKDTVSKHERILGHLKSEGYIAVSRAEDLSRAMEAAWSDKSPAKDVKDKEAIYRAVAGLI